MHWVFQIDGSNDELISCFKKGKQCESGASLLKDQTLLLNSGELDENPFSLTDTDITEAASQFTLIEEDDVDVDIEDEELLID